jgi:hypothetical protein
MLIVMKAEASRLRALAPGNFALIALLTGCSLVLGDLPPTTDEPDESSGGGSSGAGAASGSMAQGGSGAGGQGGVGGSSSGSGGIPPGCDDDGDRVASDAENCGGEDCDDSNDDVYPEQTRYSSEPRSDGGFDYNCDESVEREPLVQCALVGGACPPDQGFLDDVACGQVGRWGTCMLVSPALCMAEVIVDEQMRGCR